MAMHNSPINIWPNLARALEPQLRWLVENQADIVTAFHARPMPVVRPIKFWPDGRVRIEFVGTYHSAARAYAECFSRVCKPNANECDAPNHKETPC